MSEADSRTLDKSLEAIIDDAIKEWINTGAYRRLLTDPDYKQLAQFIDRYVKGRATREAEVTRIERETPAGVRWEKPPPPRPTTKPAIRTNIMAKIRELKKLTQQAIMARTIVDITKLQTTFDQHSKELGARWNTLNQHEQYQIYLVVTAFQNTAQKKYLALKGHPPRRPTSRPKVRLSVAKMLRALEALTKEASSARSQQVLAAKGREFAVREKDLINPQTWAGLNSDERARFSQVRAKFERAYQETQARLARPPRPARPTTKHRVKTGV